jgi:hypothetical protein
MAIRGMNHFNVLTDKLAAIRDAVGAAASGLHGHGTVQIPLPAVLVSAEKPGK